MPQILKSSAARTLRRVRSPSQGRGGCSATAPLRSGQAAALAQRPEIGRPEKSTPGMNTGPQVGRRQGIGTKIEVQTLALTGMVDLLKRIDVGVGVVAEIPPIGIKVLGTPGTGDPPILETAGVTDATACCAAC